MKGDPEELIHKNNFPAVLNLVMGASDLVGPLATNCVRGPSSWGSCWGPRLVHEHTFYKNLACVSIKRMITVCMIFYQRYTDCSLEADCTARPLVRRFHTPRKRIPAVRRIRVSPQVTGSSQALRRCVLRTRRIHIRRVIVSILAQGYFCFVFAPIPSFS